MRARPLRAPAPVLQRAAWAPLTDNGPQHTLLQARKVRSLSQLPQVPLSPSLVRPCLARQTRHRVRSPIHHYYQPTADVQYSIMASARSKSLASHGNTSSEVGTCAATSVSFPGGGRAVRRAPASSSLGAAGLQPCRCRISLGANACPCAPIFSCYAQGASA